MIYHKVEIYIFHLKLMLRGENNDPLAWARKNVVGRAVSSPKRFNRYGNIGDMRKGFIFRNTSLIENNIYCSLLPTKIAYVSCIRRAGNFNIILEL